MESTVLKTGIKDGIEFRLFINGVGKIGVNARDLDSDEFVPLVPFFPTIEAGTIYFDKCVS